MKLPLSLLKSFLPLELPLSQIGETLTLLGIEVDGIYQEKPPFQGVVAVEVVSVKPHPNAEKLQIAEVSDGSSVYQIVCGASNCRPNIKTALARVGAELIDSKGHKLVIKPAKLRGVESFGMLCALSELLGSEDNDGIMELGEEIPLGEDLLSHLWDPVFELSLTPNLGYCLSARGVARELSAFLNLPMKKTPSFDFPKTKAQTIQVSVEEPSLCPRYMGRTIEGVKIGPSPLWLQQTLKAAGVRPINNGVDITNYILLKWGQPMHAFDADLLNGSIHVKLSQKEKPFLCLDDIERTVPEHTLLICDGEKPVALAGVMGGADSAVSEKTKIIFLEAALFDHETIRKTSKKIGLRSESSLRFEKGIDPEAMQSALDEACSLFASLCGGRALSGTIDTHPSPFPPKEIRCRPERVNKLLGSQISVHEIEEIFHRLHFKAKKTEDGAFLVSVPCYRLDITEEIDLVEEVARIYGYNSLEKKSSFYTSAQLAHDPSFLFERKLRAHLVALGLQETVTSDLIGPKLAKLALEPSLPHVKFLQVLHAKSEDYSILRPSLLPGFLQVVQFNADQKNPSFAGFELGAIYFEEKGEKIELPMAGIFLTGKAAPHHWDQKPLDVDFYDLKGLIENLFDSLHLSDVVYKPSSHPSFHPGRQASLYLEGLAIGSFGEVHPLLLEPLDIKQRVFYAEISLKPLLARTSAPQIMKPIPSFPSSERDWTIPLPKDASVEPILETIAGYKSPLFEKAELIDLFLSDTQNVTLRFTYRDTLKTISFEEADAEHAKLMQIVLASLRSI